MGEITCPRCGESFCAEELIDEALSIRWDGYIAGRTGLTMELCPYKAVAVNKWTWEKKDWEKMQQWRSGWRIGVRASEQIREMSDA